jgi:two-component system, chemotaxis family, chemotaxis protein CheY
MTQPPYHGVTVLVIDDEPNNRLLFKRMLLHIGITSVADAADGKAGLDEVMRTKPTLVLCDVLMEPVDGRAFLKMLRGVKERSLATTPVIFLTGDTMTDTVRFAKEHHVDGYLVKPVSLTQLKTRIDAVLQAAAPG